MHQPCCVLSHVYMCMFNPIWIRTKGTLRHCHSLQYQMSGLFLVNEKYPLYQVSYAVPSVVYAGAQGAVCNTQKSPHNRGVRTLGMGMTLIATFLGTTTLLRYIVERNLLP